jgi:hypothetical protein
MKIRKPASFGVKSLMLPAGRLFERTFSVFSSGFSKYPKLLRSLLSTHAQLIFPREFQELIAA